MAPIGFAGAPLPRSRRKCADEDRNCRPPLQLYTPLACLAAPRLQKSHSMVTISKNTLASRIQGPIEDTVSRRSVQVAQIPAKSSKKSVQYASSIHGKGLHLRIARGSDLRVMAATQVAPAPAADKVGGDLPQGYEFDDPTKKLLPRRAGILLHPTSFPGPYGIGELGAEAFKFIDWLDSTGCSVWQVYWNLARRHSLGSIQFGAIAFRSIPIPPAPFLQSFYTMRSCLNLSLSPLAGLAFAAFAASCRSGAVTLTWVVAQVLPLVPPGRKSGEDGSPYSGQVRVVSVGTQWYRFSSRLFLDGRIRLAQ